MNLAIYLETFNKTLQGLYTHYANDEGEGIHLEIEARLGTLGKSQQIFEVDLSAYTALQDACRAMGYTEEITATQDYGYAGGYRKIVRSSKEIVWERKEKPKDNSISIPEYGIKIGWAVEQTLGTRPPQISENEEPEIIRVKLRNSYTMGSGNRIDITKVDTTNISSSSTQQRGSTYEVEVELIGGISNLSNWYKDVETVWLMLNKTDYTYTLDDRTSMTRYVNSISNGNQELFHIDRAALVEARPLKAADVVESGILKGPGAPYIATLKPDGRRMLLIFHTTGIWLAHPPSTYNLIYRATLGGTLTKIVGYVIDGELIPLDKRLPVERRLDSKEKKYEFAVFDCLAIPGHSLIGQTYTVRRSYLDNVTFQGIETLHIIHKTHRIINSPNEFFKVTGELLALHPSYETDGLIFTPNNAPYNPQSDLKIRDLRNINPNARRLLTYLPDVCKWKPVEQITIDFKIKWRNTSGVLELEFFVVDYQKTEVIFRGSPKYLYHYSSEILDFDPSYPKRIRDLPTDTIVEYGYNFEKQLLEPRRVRPDKTSPNAEKVAITNWNDVMGDSLTTDDIKGFELKLVFNYHNRIKRELLEKVVVKGLTTTSSGVTTRNKKPFTSRFKAPASRGSQKHNPITSSLPQFSQRKVLLDIGSGRGGDIGKWEGFKLVIAVEPDETNRRELEQRLQSRLEGTNNKNPFPEVIIVPTFGEDTITIQQALDAATKITNSKVQVISLMLSLTFFWQSNDVLEGLMKTITTLADKNCSIVWLTLDGDAVLQGFKSPITDSSEAKDTPNGKLLDFIGAQILLPKNEENKRKIVTSIPGTIVGNNQEEYLVQITDLIYRLSLYGFAPTETHKATGEKLLSITQMKYSSLYSYGIFERLIEGINRRGVAPPPEVFVGGRRQQPPLLEVFEELPLAPGELPYLEVVVTFQNKCINDDEYEVLVTNNIPTKEVIVRLATIGGGDCFIHAVLKAMYKAYQESKDCPTRVKIAKSLRRDLAYKLQLPDPRNPDYTVWETANNSSYVSGMVSEILNPKLLDEGFTDYSLAGLQRLLNSSAYLGDESYQYVSDQIQMDIYIFLGTIDVEASETQGLRVVKLTPILSTKREVLRSAICILGNKVHYEVLALYRDGLFQTIFNAGDTFVEEIGRLFGGSGVVNLTPEEALVGVLNSAVESEEGRVEVLETFGRRILRIGEVEPIVRLVERIRELGYLV